MITTKVLRNKKVGIRTVKKMTQAMQAIAVSKMRRTQQRMRGSRPYATMIRRIIHNLTRAELSYPHPYLIEDSTVKTQGVGYLVISSRRGLCGSLNLQLFKSVLAHKRQHNSQGIHSVFGLIGSKAVNYFKPLGEKIVAQKTGLGDVPLLKEVIGPIHSLLNLFKNHEIQNIYLCYNRFISATQLAPTIELLVPFLRTSENDLGDSDSAKVSQPIWDYIYEPDPKLLLDHLLPRCIESLVYQAVLENLACEQASRTLAMQTATENAQKALAQLDLEHNKLRQAGITQELAEIVSGSLTQENTNNTYP